MPLKYFLIKTVALALFCVCISSLGYAQSDADPSTLLAGVANIAAPQRVEFARNLYKSTCRELSEKTAMAKLDELTLLARKIDDKALECAVYDMRADYYSVNYKSYNETSTYYHTQAIKFATDNDMLAEEGIYMNRYATYCMIYNKNTLAIRYYLMSLDALKKVGYANITDIGNYFFNVSSFYYSIEDFENAKRYALRALEFKTLNKRLTISMINTIGLVYRNTKQYSKAIDYFDKAITLSLASKDTAWLGITKGNLGSVYMLQKRYAQALPYIITDYETSLKFGENYNAALAVLRLAEINLIQRNTAEASEQLKQVAALTITQKQNLPLHVDLYRLKSMYYKQVGDINNAFDYYEKYDQARDSLKNQDDLDAVERVKIQWEQARFQQSIQQLENKASADKLIRNSIIIVVTLVLVIAGLIYNRKLLKVRKNSEILRVEKLRVDQELSYAESELLLYTQNLQEKNAIIQNFKDEIEQLNSQHADNEKAEQLNSMMQTHIMTDDRWTEFKRLFQKVHPGFFQKLKENHPVISETDTRLLALMRLDINNREIAAMIGITPDGVKKAKQRLRKKMDINGDNSIEHIISAI